VDGNVEKVDQVSISPTFYEQLFHTIVFLTVFMYLQFWFVIFMQKKIIAKVSHKMLMKLTTERHPMGKILSQDLCLPMTPNPFKTGKQVVY